MCKQTRQAGYILCWKSLKTEGCGIVQRLDAFLQQVTRDGTLPGAVICVAYQGEIVWHQAYGAAALVPERRSMQCDTLFDIASLTKVVATTSLVLMAHHEGVCRLDDRLERFYPQTVNSALGAVTLRQLLAHTGGLAAWRALYQELYPAGPQRCPATAARTRRREAAGLILQMPLVYSAGSQMVYSDLGFILLGDILETQYRQSLDRLFHHRVARPLDLRATAYRPLGGDSPLPTCPAAYAATEVCPWRQRLLVGEVHDENAWAMGGVAGHAGLFATVSDLWQFVRALLETAANCRSWLPASLLRESWQRYSEPLGTTRTLGWDTPTPGTSSAGESFSVRSVGHLGFTGCSIWIDLKQRVTVILCTNRVHPDRHTSGIARVRPTVHNLAMRALGLRCTIDAKVSTPPKPYCGLQTRHHKPCS
jgi:CubicO group peptidase (beta-lactamase class C family)